MLEKIIEKLKNCKNKDWWKAALIRALRTWAQTALGALGGAVLISDVNWGAVLSAATLAALTSLLMSIKGLPELDTITHYEYLDENGVPVNGHFMTVKAKEVNEDDC